MKKSNLKIMVIGSGAWGTSIANHLAKNSHDVYINSIDDRAIADINKNNTNKQFLPNIKLSKSLKAGRELKLDVDYIFLVIPSDTAPKVFEKLSKEKFKKNCCFVLCSKGVDHNSLELLSDSFERITNNKNYVVLSGPNFAIEVALSSPTITNISSPNKNLAQKVINILNNDYFKAIYFNDHKTAEVCGVVKNILAIGCGIIDELELGVNAKSALILKGIKEIQLICSKIKASTDLANPAGFGDIFLTCSSVKSRNKSLGKLLAQGKSFEKNVTYEGANSAKVIVAMAKKYKIKLELCEEISKIIVGRFSAKEISQKIKKAILQ